MRNARVDLDRLAPTDLQRVTEREKTDRSTTTIIPWKTEGVTAFNIAVVLPAADSPTGDCIYPMSHDYRIDRMILHRLEILADVTGYRVIGVETPGITMLADNPAATPRSWVAPRLLWQLVRGDFSGIARLQKAAIEEASTVVVADSRIVGESLGAQLGASLAGVAGGARSLEVVEPANCRALTPLTLLALQRSLLGVETERKAAYVEHNRNVGWGDVLPFELSSGANAQIDRRLKAFHRQGRYAAATAMGLRRGLWATLESLSPGIDVRIWLADASSVCRLGDVEWLANKLTSRARDVGTRCLCAPRTWPEGIGHHALTDLDMMFAFSRALESEWKHEDRIGTTG